MKTCDQPIGEDSAIGCFTARLKPEQLGKQP